LRNKMRNKESDKLNKAEEKPTEPEEQKVVDKEFDFTEEGEEVQAFYEDLKKYAKKHGLVITNIKGWTRGRIIRMARNDRRCACRPKQRTCPCPEGLEECRTAKDHECICSVFRLGNK